MDIDIRKIQSLVGPVTEENLENVEAFYCDTTGVFIPTLGQCQYAITADHTHPTYMVVILQDLFDNVAALPDVPFRGSGDTLATAISPGVPHTEAEAETFTRYSALFVIPSLFESVWRTYTPDGPPRLEWTTWRVDPEIHVLLRDFMAEFENDLPGRESLMQAIALRLIHLLLRSYHHIALNVERITTRTEVAKALELMHRKFAEKMSVADLAAHAKMSESHFARVFKSEVGLSPLEKLIAIRLNNAKQMLNAGRRAVSEVALDCGFATPSHFSTAFTRAFGMTPSAFRKQAVRQKRDKAK